MKNTTKEITKRVTEGIIESLEKGVVPWKSGMKGLGQSTNFDGVPYQGFNRWILNSAVINNNFETNQWITFNRCRKEGGKVIKGSKSTEIVFWKPMVFKKKDENGEEVEKSFGFLKTFRVFNLCQTTLYNPKTFVAPKVELNTDMAEQLIGQWNEEVNIRYGYDNMNSPYYSPLRDYINIPFGDAVEWDNNEVMHKVTFHEMIHSTGHTSRLNRFNKAQLDGEQLHSEGQYSAEELVAELGAQVLSDTCGFVQDHLEMTSAYIGSWLKHLKNNPEWVMWASGRAEKAVDMVLKVSNLK